jgi:hypothetical protein
LTWLGEWRGRVVIRHVVARETLRYVLVDSLEGILAESVGFFFKFCLEIGNFLL